MNFEELVLGATNPLLLGPDYDKCLQLVDILSHSPELAKPIVECVLDQMDALEPNSIKLAFALSEMLLKNCPVTYSWIGSDGFLDVVVDLVEEDDPDFKEVNYLAKDFLLFYGTAFARDHSTVFAAKLNALRKKGVRFPPRRTDDDQWTPEGVEAVGSGTPSASVPSANDEFTPSNLYYKITQIRESTALLDELTTHLKKSGEDSDVLSEVVSQCQSLYNNFLQFLNSENHLQEKVFNDLLLMNESIASSLKRYNKVHAKVLKKALKTSAKPPPSAPSVPATSPPTTVEQSPPVPSAPVVDLLGSLVSPQPTAEPSPTLLSASPTASPPSAAAPLSLLDVSPPSQSTPVSTSSLPSGSLLDLLNPSTQPLSPIPTSTPTSVPQSSAVPSLLSPTTSVLPTPSPSPQPVAVTPTLLSFPLSPAVSQPPPPVSSPDSFDDFFSSLATRSRPGE
eukprot:TRINITY_DN4975_c0_g1_i1.p1 TRINITY_DN4975_c0_g1~~TRINITY_DN4975_c0_g1_i1.p1  ORF type:complete len:474 (+),score=138.01 TRINITY_DN4975_c0_g1_i1:72-1424(+)